MILCITASSLTREGFSETRASRLLNSGSCSRSALAICLVNLMGRCGIRGLRPLDFDGCSSSTCSLCTTVGPGDLKSVLHRKAGMNFEYPITPKMSVYSDQRSGVQYPSALSRDTARIGRCPLKSRSESLRTCSANVEFFPCLNSFSGNVKGKTATSPNTHNADDFPELFGPVKMLTCGSKVNSTSSSGW